MDVVWQSILLARVFKFATQHPAKRRCCDAAASTNPILPSLMSVFVRMRGVPSGIKPEKLPPELEAEYKDAMSRNWWLWDVASYIAHATVLSLLYILIACSLDAQAAAGGSISTSSACRSVQSAPLRSAHSTARNAPVADEYSKLVLFPAYATAAYTDMQAPAAAAAAAKSQHGAAAGEPASLQQLLYSKAAAAVASLSAHRSSMGLSMLLQPKTLLRSVPLLFIWRVWFMADMMLLVKGVMCFVGLWLAVSKPGLYRRHGVHTAIIVTYILAPLMLLPLRLLTCHHPNPLGAADSRTTAAAATSSSSPHMTAQTYATMCSINSDWRPRWPLSYFTTCPVPTAAEWYRAMLSCASVTVMVDSFLHPLPLAWRAVVSTASWMCLASCSVLIKLRYAPAAVTAAAAAGLNNSAAAASSLGIRSSRRMDMGVFFGELLAGCLDGLVLAVLLPLSVHAWMNYRSRQRFVASHQSIGLNAAGASQLQIDMGTKGIQQQQQQQEQQHSKKRPGGMRDTSTAAAGTDAVYSSLAPSTPATSENLGVLGPSKELHATAIHLQRHMPRHPPTAQAAVLQAVTQAHGRGSERSSQRGRLAAASTQQGAAFGRARNDVSPAAPSIPHVGSWSSLESTASSSLITAGVAHSKSSADGSGSSNDQQTPARLQQAATSANTAADAGGDAGPSGVAVPSFRTARSATAAAEGHLGLPPPSASRSGTLYSSPLETVIVSFKLTSAPRSSGSAASAEPAAAAAVAPPAATADVAGDVAPAGSTEVAPPAAADAPPLCSAAGSGGDFLQQQQVLAASGASRRLTAAIEAAVRAVVAQSQLHVLTTNVSAFPGCLHVVLSVNLVALTALQRLAAAAAAREHDDVPDAQVHIEGAADSFSSVSGSHASADAVDAAAAAAGEVGPDSQAVPLAKCVDWSQVVQQLQQQGVIRSSGPGDIAESACPAQLQRMAVLDGSGQEMYWCWQQDQTAGADLGATAAAACVSSTAAAAGMETAAASYVTAVQRASLELPTAAAAAASRVAAAEADNAVGLDCSSNNTQSSATSSDAHALIDSAASAASSGHGLSDTPAVAGLAVYQAATGLDTLSPGTPRRAAANQPTTAAATVCSIPKRRGYERLASRVQAAPNNTTARAEMPAAAGARVAAAALGGVYPAAFGVMPSFADAGTAADSMAMPSGWFAGTAAAAAAAVMQPSPASSSASSNRYSADSSASRISRSTAPPHSNSPAAPSTSAAASTRLPKILGNAHGITVSGFCLPTDGARLEHAVLSGPSLVASLAPVLTVPDSLEASLAAQEAGLRIVITEAAAGLEDASTSGQQPGLTVWSWNEHASLSQWPSLELPGPADIWQTGLLPQASLLRNAQSGPVNPMTGGETADVAAAVLVDVTFWPDGGSHTVGAANRSSSGSNGVHRTWPMGGAVVLQELLPCSSDGLWQARHNGSVLAINILATPAKQGSGRAATASTATVVSEFLLLQLPLLCVPWAVCSALAELQDRMAVETGDGGRAYHEHLLPLVRDVASVLLDRSAARQAAAAAAHAGAGLAVADMARQQLCKFVIGFLQAQGFEECAAVLQQLAGWEAVAVETAPAAASTEIVPITCTPVTDIEPEPMPDDAVVLSDEVENIEYVPYTSAAAAPAIAAAPAAPAAAAAVKWSTLFADVPATTAAADACDIGGEAMQVVPHLGSSVAKAAKEAAAAREDAKAARQKAAEASAALNSAIQAMSSLSATAAAAAEQAQRAHNTAAAAARRAAAAESWARRQHAVHLIGGGQVESGSLGQGIWAVLGSASGLRNGGNARDAEMLAGPPELPELVTWHDVLLGFKDARLEVQYRRLKAMHVKCVDRAALLLHVVREATVVWRLGMMLIQHSGGSQLSLVLLCKYEAVTVLPYVMSLLCPDFWIHHRNFMLMLSQIACALTMGMITATEVYRHEWTQLLSPDSPASAASLGKEFTLGGMDGASSSVSGAAAAAAKGLLARPGMLLVWFYLVVPLLQQLCLPEQLLGACISQAVQTLLAYKLLFKGKTSVWALLPWLIAGAAVSGAVAYVTDYHFRRQAVASARRSGARGRGRPTPPLEAMEAESAMNSSNS